MVCNVVQADKPTRNKHCTGNDIQIFPTAIYGDIWSNHLDNSSSIQLDAPSLYVLLLLAIRLQKGTPIYELFLATITVDHFPFFVQYKRKQLILI